MTIALQYPVEQPVVITQPFGARPEYYRQFGLPGHEGIDFRAVTGAPILCAWEGHVIAVGEWGNYGYQVRVRSDVDQRQYEHIYAHGQRGSATVKVGYLVTAGQLLMRADSTGNVQGAHLHFTLKCYGATARGDTNYPNNIIDPTPYFTELQASDGAKRDRVRITARPRLRVRKEPSPTAAVVGYVEHDQALVLLGERNGWGLIAAPAGWIDLKWTKFDSDNVDKR
jgi:murein DD-endopeptidase MepM/ murein hydrolase activator NlpD